MAIFSKQLMSFYNPFDLRRVLVLHNLLCCALSLVSLTLLLVGLWEVRTPTFEVIVHPKFANYAGDYTVFRHIYAGAFI